MCELLFAYNIDSSATNFFKGFYCFGTDLVGHGNSDKIEGLPVFIPDFKECLDDIIDHINYVKQFMESQYGQVLPLFILGHSMGKNSILLN